MSFPVSGINKLELVNCIIAWEGKGYEVCCPIQEIKTSWKRFNYVDNNIKSRQFEGIDMQFKYYVRMRKVEVGNDARTNIR